MASKPSRTFRSRGRPPRLAGGIAGSTSAHSASVKSLGYRKPRRFAARRCSGVHIEHPLASMRVLDNESHPIPPTQQLLGSALRVSDEEPFRCDVEELNCVPGQKFKSKTFLFLAEVTVDEGGRDLLPE